jgi:hypothetical protein
MTDEELKDLVASNSRAITRLEGLHEENERAWQEMREELRASRVESERRWQETQEELRASRVESERRWQEGQASQAESDRRWQETQEELRASRVESERRWQEGQASQAESDRRWREEIHASRAETDRLVEAIHREIGSLGNKIGDYAEGLCRPALEHILRDHFRMSEVALRVNSRRNGHEIELDMLGHANDRINKAYVAEIKSTLRQEGIEQILEHLRAFPDFFPQHRGKELYGVLAAIDAPPAVQEKALREGLYLVLVSEDAFRLVEREGFQPRDFSS